MSLESLLILLPTNKFEQAKELLSRVESVKDAGIMPRLILNPDKKDFYNMDIDDFTIVDYNPVSPQISLELGI